MISGYEIANVFLLVYAGLFPIINPIGGAPIFLGLTRHCTDPERNELALRVSINSFFLLLGSLLIGSYVLEFFGITLPIVRVAGGLIVAATGWNLLQSSDDFTDDRTSHQPKYRPTRSIRLRCRSRSVRDRSQSLSRSAASGRGGFHLTDLAVSRLARRSAVSSRWPRLSICVTDLPRGPSARWASQGTNVVVRLSAFILFCIGIEIIWSGYSALTRIAG